jgi:soluble lytic murein transglycosylase-like protein
MSISQINSFPGDGRNHLYRSSSNQLETENHSFKEILQKTTKTNGYTNDIPSASKFQLVDIINNIKVQMDTKLMSALSMATCGELDFLSPTNPMNSFIQPQPSPERDMSNKWHTVQNNDISDGPTNLDAIISQAAKTYGVDESLIKSVIKVESNFNSNSTSPKGAMGLMQIMPETARELGVQNPYDPVQNVEAGTRYLKMLLNRYDGNISLSLAAYNWGMGNLERRPDQMPAETRLYMDNVRRHYERMKG